MSLKEEKNVQEEKQKLSRRDFIKAAGVTAGVAGVAAASSATPALASDAKKEPILDFAIREVDRPSYMDYPFEFDDNKFQRTEHSKVEEAFSPDYSRERLDGQFWYFVYEETRRRLAREGRPGYSALDKALCDAAQTTMIVGQNMKSWSPLGAGDVELGKEVKENYANPEDNNRYVKKAAQFFGAGDCGVAAVNEKWFYKTSVDFGPEGQYELPIIFSDEHDEPTITEEAKYIPKTMNRVVVMIIPMEGEIAKYSPTRLADAISTLAYSKKVELPTKLAEFIRGLGYNAIPMGNDTALNIPLAIDAGLGELGRQGLLIHPEYGALCKIAKVVTDMPLAVDKPITFGVGEFCRTCRKCADNCPSQSISFDTEPSYEVKCPANIPGVKKWYIDGWSCFDYWLKQNGVCMNCITTCTYSKPQTWIHDVVKGISSRTPIFNGTFRVLDDVLGYGKTAAENDPAEWWSQEEYGKEWLNLK